MDEKSIEAAVERGNAAYLACVDDGEAFNTAIRAAIAPYRDAEIAALEARVRELEAENARLREALGPFVAVGIEWACDECGGDDTECPEDCAVRIGRAALKGEG